MALIRESVATDDDIILLGDIEPCLGRKASVKLCRRTVPRIRTNVAPRKRYDDHIAKFLIVIPTRDQ